MALFGTGVFALAQMHSFGGVKKGLGQPGSSSVSCPLEEFQLCHGRSDDRPPDTSFVECAGHARVGRDALVCWVGRLGWVGREKQSAQEASVLVVRGGNARSDT